MDWNKYCLVILVLQLIALAHSDDKPCLLPDCYIASDKIPGNLDELTIPQLVLFSYTGLISSKEESELKKIFTSSYRNPNNCPVGVTAFVSGERYTVMCSVHRLYVRGFEIATHGYNDTTPYVTGTGDTGWNKTRWEQQIAAHRDLLTLKAFVPREDIIGMRAPSFVAGGDAMFSMLTDEQFHYDSTLLYQGLAGKQIWPFTLARPRDQCATMYGCPNEAFPNFWEFSVHPLTGPTRPCATLSECVSDAMDENDVYDLLVNNFQRCFLHNARAPLQINLTPAAFASAAIKKGLQYFLDMLTSRDDVWVVTYAQALAWVRHPTPLNQLEFLPPFWDCDGRKFASKCNNRGSEQIWTPSVFAQVLDIENIHIWQVVLLILGYIIVLIYDRNRSDLD